MEFSFPLAFSYLIVLLNPQASSFQITMMSVPVIIDRVQVCAQVCRSVLEYEVHWCLFMSSYHTTASSHSRNPYSDFPSWAFDLK